MSQDKNTPMLQVKDGIAWSSHRDCDNSLAWVNAKLSRTEEEVTDLPAVSGFSRPPLLVSQVHGKRAIEVGHEITLDEHIEADALWTTDRDFPIAVMTADCMPIFITSDQMDCIAIIHAGWRGLLSGIIEETLAQLPCSMDSLRVCLGPHIRQDRYQVDAIVYEAFMEEDPKYKVGFKPCLSNNPEQTHWWFAMDKIAILKLQSCGVENITNTSYCSYDDEHFFSYRKENNTKQRTVHLIGLCSV